MNPMDVVAAVGRVFGDGLTLAAEVLCPRDHTVEDRLRSWESAAVAVEDEICDEAEAEAADEADVAVESGMPLRLCTWCYGPYFRCKGRHPIISPELFYACVPDSSAAVSAAADPSPADDHHALRGAGDEGPEGASAIPPAAPSGQPADPGEVTAPSPGELTTAELLYEAAGSLESAIQYDRSGGDWHFTRLLIAQLRDRAAKFDAVKNVTK